MDDASPEILLSPHPGFPTRLIDHQIVVPFTKESLDTDKPILVGNPPTFNFAGGPTKQ